MTKPREYRIYERAMWSEVALRPGPTRDWIAHILVEKSAYDKVVRALKEASKLENFRNIQPWEALEEVGEDDD